VVALRLVGNIVTGDDVVTQVRPCPPPLVPPAHRRQFIIRSGAVTRLNAMLFDKAAAVRKEGAWTLSNIAAGDRSQIQVWSGQGVGAGVTAGTGGDRVRHAGDRRASGAALALQCVCGRA
jgi:hypothetical protein